MFLLNGKPLGVDTAFKIDGTSYPSNWLRLTSLEEKNAVGITEVADEDTQYDSRYYWGVGNPKQLEDLTVTPEGGGESYVQKGMKSQHLAQTKTTANQLLSATDWMVIRKAERDVAIPAATVTYRAAVLTECDRLLAAIAAAADVPALMAVTAAWPESN